MKFGSMDRAKTAIGDVRQINLVPDEVVVSPEAYHDLIEEFNSRGDRWYYLPVERPRLLVDAVLGIPVVVDPDKHGDFMGITVRV